LGCCSPQLFALCGRVAMRKGGQQANVIVVNQP
jgi:hypothetical protein